MTQQIINATMGALKMRIKLLFGNEKLWHISPFYSMFGISSKIAIQL
jgi:hypothetical protein